MATAQAQVQLTEARLAGLLEALPGSNVLVSKQGQLITANQCGLDWLGCASDKKSEPDCTVALQHHFQNSAAFVTRAQQLRAAGQAMRGEVAVLTDGQTLEWDYLPLGEGEEGHLLRFQPLSTTTAQRDFYETILQQLPVEVAVFDAEHRYRFVNVNGILNATTRAWVIGHTDFEYCAHFQRPLELAQERHRCFEQALQTRAPITWEEMQETADGTQYVRRYFLPVFAPDGTLHMMVGLGEDITERRRVENQLAEQRAFYEYVLDHLPCDVGVFDHKFRYLFVNASGIKDPELRKWVIGKDNYAYFSRTNRPVSMAHERHAQFEQAVQQRGLVTYDETFLRPDGDRYMYRCLQPVFHPDGSLHMILGYGLDVTERVATERALRHAKLAAESAVRARELFLANMSHEIRTPMNAILGMSQLLAKTPLTPTQSSYQQAITTSADNLLVIINDILDLSKLEAGKMVLEQVGFSPAHLLAQVEQTLQYKAAEKGLCLRTQVGQGLPAVLLGDPYRITQVLLNLAGNAIKFTEKGHVAVSCEVVAADAPSGTVDVQFEVSDTGIGIEPEFLAHIFQEFSQEDASVTRKFGGTGLGLPICRNLVKLMGGDVQLESEKHRGTVTRFTLRLPVGTANDLLPQALLPEDSPLRQHLRHKHVLLVEDNRFNRQIAKTFLQQAHVQVTEAVHGAEALALAQEQSFDLILMDIQMPILDGYGATTALRQQLQLTTPIIALTANAIKGEREKCLAAGMNGYLAKPFQEAELLRVVSEWVLPQAGSTTPASQFPTPATPTSELYRTDELLKVGQGDLTFVNFMLETFVESSEEGLQELATGLQEGNVARLKSAAHTLKPSLAHLHVTHLLPAVTELDQWQGEFQHEALTALVTTITQHLREVISHMRLALAAPQTIAAE
ncbi:ATP-binding protein [Hymenobacter sp. 5414T-23]|uniref:hybrid sensor histidine kinase/response regulator n=1 Tax=Hymenobacter sp. 5414T-23 TaxID=2932252 RepID=UPI001FD0141F|nr:ATP-binding protein [Hymenobacter sp. 5414T-23]UOQ80444.1 ATP-binding protein [Hymenobacter sp. 5414T-23]